MSDINDENATMDSKSLQIAGHGVCNPSCYESVHHNLYRKLQKESEDYDDENKERCLIKHAYRRD